MKIIIKATLKALVHLQVQINSIYEYSINQHYLKNNLWDIEFKDLASLEVVLALIQDEKNIKLWDVIR